MEGLLTADEFANEVRLTSRTVRTYHARGLLQPPIRVGRTPYYGNHHLQRMKLVLRMQSAGLPLEAVRALLEPDVVLYDALEFGQFIRHALRARPELLEKLIAAGLLVPHVDGSFGAQGIRAMVLTRDAYAPGLSPARALELLAETVIEAAPHARAAMERVRRAIAERDLPGLDHERRVELAVEVFRVSLGAGDMLTPVPPI